MVAKQRFEFIASAMRKSLLQILSIVETILKKNPMKRARLYTTFIRRELDFLLFYQDSLLFITGENKDVEKRRRTIACMQNM